MRICSGRTENHGCITGARYGRPVCIWLVKVAESGIFEVGLMLSAGYHKLAGRKTRRCGLTLAPTVERVDEGQEPA